MRHFLAVLVLVACSQPSPPSEESGNKTNNHPQSSALHQQLFSAAKTTDKSGFQAILTPKSIEMLDEYFNRMELLQRPVGSAPYGWKEFIRLHAELAQKRPDAEPYAVFKTDNGPRLDVASHPNSAFLKKAMILPPTPIPKPNVR